MSRRVAIVLAAAATCGTALANERAAHADDDTPLVAAPLLPPADVRSPAFAADDAPPTTTAPTRPTTPAPTSTPTPPTNGTPTSPTPETPSTTGPATSTSPTGTPSGAPTSSAPTTMAAAPAASDTSTSTTAAAPEAPPDLSDQAIGAEIGASSGGRDTPGGLRVAGHYLYQLAAKDWFDGLAAFTFGGGSAACFRDRMNVYLCDHGIADGGSIEIAATVRHFFASPAVGGNSGQFWPFLLGGVGIRVDRFSADDVTGLAIPLHLGAGMRVSVTSSVAITAQGALEIGFGAFNHTLGLEPQFGAALTAGAEFRL